jgi:hypothetical protein
VTLTQLARLSEEAKLAVGRNSIRRRLRPGFAKRAETRQVPLTVTVACAPGLIHLPALSTSSQHAPVGRVLEVTWDETESRRCRDLCGNVERMLVAIFATGVWVVGRGTGTAGTGAAGALTVNVLVDGPTNVAFGVTPAGGAASVSSQEQTIHAPPVNGIVTAKVKRPLVTVRESTNVVPGSAEYVDAHGGPPVPR